MQRCPPPLLTFALAALVAAAMILGSACSSKGGAVLKLDGGGLQGVQSLPREITRLLEDLGYEWVPVRDAAVAVPVKMARQAGEWTMRFQAKDNPDIGIDARFSISGNRVHLRLREAGEKGLSPTSEGYYRELRERLELEYGSDLVSSGGFF